MLLLLLLLASIAGCADEQAPRSSAPAPTGFSSAEHRFTAEIPAGWDVAPRSLTPHLRNPVEILSAGTVRDLRPAKGPCAHVPVGALERMGPEDVFVSVQERYGEPQFPDRPAHFTLPAAVPHTDAAECVRNGSSLEIHWFGFRDARRGFHVLVALGREAPQERRDEALDLLDSLRFAPGPPGVDLDPDRAVGFSARGLSWQMPLPPWRHYDWPMTSVQGERLKLGTFELERTPADRNCTPRAAIDAMPDDGAFIYVLEHAGRGSAPERTGELTLGPETAYECMGLSRMVSWRQNGRALQAFVYLGRRASPELEREARSILNSIQVE
jgi:hypothetical protein